jgi:RHS repeat-associated protein
VAHYSVHTDHQGSVRALTDLTGGVVNTYAYDAYGNAEAAVESLPQRFRYTGREWDGVTRLYHYRARAYDPETGRFLQEDPLWFNAGDLNVYRYVGNNPVNATDPSGMASASDSCIQMGISVRILTAGRMATQSMLSTGARTARYIKSSGKNNLSSIAASLACTFFILADAIEQAGPNTEIVGLDVTRCGVVAMSVPTQPQPIPCDEQWDFAYQVCEDQIANNKRGPYNTGGHTDIHKCAKGLVSQSCGGNKVH